MTTKLTASREDFSIRSRYPIAGEDWSSDEIGVTSDEDAVNWLIERIKIDRVDFAAVRTNPEMREKYYASEYTVRRGDEVVVGYAILWSIADEVIANIEAGVFRICPRGKRYEMRIGGEHATYIWAASDGEAWREVQRLVAVDDTRWVELQRDGKTIVQSDAVIQASSRGPVVTDRKPCYPHPSGGPWVRGLTADGKTCWV